MHDPHVTVGIYSDKSKAEEHVRLVNQILPIQVTITGVTIN